MAAAGGEAAGGVLGVVAVAAVGGARAAGALDGAGAAVPNGWLGADARGIERGGVVIPGVGHARRSRQQAHPASRSPVKHTPASVSRGILPMRRSFPS